MNNFFIYFSNAQRVNFKLTGKYFHDYFYDNIYMFDKENGVTTIYKLNIKHGTKELIATLKDIRHPKDIKVLKGQVYFLVLVQNRYNNLMKVKM